MLVAQASNRFFDPGRRPALKAFAAHAHGLWKKVTLLLVACVCVARASARERRQLFASFWRSLAKDWGVRVNDLTGVMWGGVEQEGSIVS